MSKAENLIPILLSEEVFTDDELKVMKDGAVTTPAFTRKALKLLEGDCFDERTVQTGVVA